MVNNKCVKAYNSAQKRRLEHPFPSGIFKLREVRNALIKYQRCIFNIGRYNRGVIGARHGDIDLGGCMAYERGPWLKHLPISISRLLGWKWLPAVAALEGDGVSERYARELLQRHQCIVQSTLDECDQISRQLSPIEQEYYRLAIDSSELSELVESLLYKMDFLLHEVDLHLTQNRIES
jgi:hypothetical protein